MKVKTSVTLSSETLEKIDCASTNRSAFIERVVEAHFRRLERAERSRREIDILNRLAVSKSFEREQEELLALQVDPFELGDEVEVLGEG